MLRYFCGLKKGTVFVVMSCLDTCISRLGVSVGSIVIKRPNTLKLVRLKSHQIIRILTCCTFKHSLTVSKKIYQKAILLLCKLTNRLYICEVFAMKACSADNHVTREFNSGNRSNKHGNCAYASGKIDILLKIPLVCTATVCIIFRAVFRNSLQRVCFLSICSL